MLLSADCERKQESTEDIRGSNSLPSGTPALLISPDSHLDSPADICRHNCAHVDLLLSTPGSPEDFQSGKFSHFLLSHLPPPPPPFFFLGHGKKILVFGIRHNPMTQFLRAGREKKRPRCCFLHCFLPLKVKVYLQLENVSVVWRRQPGENFHFYLCRTSIDFLKLFLGPKKQ